MNALLRLRLFRLPARAAAQPRPFFTQQLAWVAGAFALTIVPHLGDVRPWLVVLAFATVVWRLTIELREWSLPNKWLRIAIALGAMLGVLATYRTLNGLEAGTAFLIVMGAMKLLESESRRDLTVVVFVSYFLLFAGFLYDQQLILLPYMLVAIWLLTATLMRIHQSEPASSMEALGTTGKMFLQALPLALLLFLLFPRLPGQFWAVPARQSATTGLDEEMSPGDVSELSVSGAIAFRVKFEGAIPPRGELYWRGLVLHDFDGRTWRRPRAVYVERPLVPVGPAYQYRLMLEPHNRPWVFSLDAPTEWPRGTRRTFDYELVSNRQVATLTAYELKSVTSYRIEGPLPRLLREADLRLPPDRNPRSRELAQRLRAEASNDEAFIDAVLAMFRAEEFYYTLEPPRLESDSVDDFLFNTRRGFCEHFASAFTFLARAAGIPARVVAGYQGGELNPLSGYVVVRQSDAHAWSEVWLEGRGWVRVDPTAAVAPERIQQGIEAAVSEEESVPGRVFARSSLLAQLRNVWDALNTYWNDNVVKFGQDHQLALLQRLGFEDADWRHLGIGLVLAFIAFFATLGLYLALRYRAAPRDPLVQVYERLCRQLARGQLPRAPHEGPRDYLSRVSAARPDLAPQLQEILRLYLNLRYGPTPLASELSRLKFLVNQLKLR
jgi:transglutaminase-like putative cysteine protease